MNHPSANPTQPESNRSIWVFTPSRTAPEDLEAIFVQRHELLKDAVERVRESALTDHKHHLLFVGPRGCGKTHLITLIVSRISADAEAAAALRLAWLNEDETCTSLLELLLKIHAALEKRYPAEFRTDDLAGAYELKATAAQDFVAQRLLVGLGPKTLMIVTENLDALFDSMGQEGQKQLRAFIQEHPRITIVGTAQRLVEDLSDRTSPFFGFFQTEHLKTLTVEQATDLLQNIARLQGKDDVIAFLATGRGWSRVRALHHLSGGNHRIYIVLSQFITRESMDTLVGPFLKMVDELTPYYQERVRWLPPLQRKIVELLCTCESTVPVKEIARRLFSTPQTISSQLQDLREKGYVESSQRGRESLYEISEPLMRLCVEVKENQNNQPLRLLVDFLRIWYDDGELKRRLGQCQPASPFYFYLESALERNSTEGNLRVKMLAEEFMGPEFVGQITPENIRGLEARMSEDYLLALQCQKEGDVAGAIQCLGDALVAEKTISAQVKILYHRGLLHGYQSNIEAAIADFTQVIGLPGAPLERLAKALFHRGLKYAQQGNCAAAIADYSRVVDTPYVPLEEVALALFHRGLMHYQQGNSEAAITDYSCLIEMPDAPHEHVANALFHRGLAHGENGYIESAIADYSRFIDLPEAQLEQVATAIFNRGVSYTQRGDSAAAISDYSRFIGLAGIPSEKVAKALLYRGVRHGEQGDTEAEIADYARIIDLPSAPPSYVAEALFGTGLTHFQKGDCAAAIACYSRVIELPSATREQVARALVNRGAARAQQGDNMAAIADYNCVIEQHGASPEHVASALYNRSITYAQQGEIAVAIQDLKRLIELPDDLHDEIIDAYQLLAVLHCIEGQWNEGIAALEAGLNLGSQQMRPRVELPLPIIGVFYAAGLNLEGRRVQAGAIYSLYAKHAAEALLGEALVKHLGAVFSEGAPWPSAENLDQWFAAWQVAAGDAPEFKLPLRLLRTGVEFVKSGGKEEGILLDLTSPERSVLRQALGLQS